MAKRIDDELTKSGSYTTEVGVMEIDEGIITFDASGPNASVDNIARMTSYALEGGRPINISRYGHTIEIDIGDSVDVIKDKLLHTNVPAGSIHRPSNDLSGKIGSTIDIEGTPAKIQDVKIKDTVGGGFSINIDTDIHNIKADVYATTDAIDGKQVYTVYSGALPQGSGLGYGVYETIWDIIGSKGGIYKPSSSLETANPFRLSLNMLRYANKKGWDKVDHLRINGSMWGGPNIPQTLTKDNLKAFNKNLISELKLNIGISDSKLKSMSVKELKDIIESNLDIPYSGGNNEMMITLKSVQDLKNYMLDHSPNVNFSMIGLVGIGALLTNKDTENNDLNQ